MNAVRGDDEGLPFFNMIGIPIILKCSARILFYLLFCTGKIRGEKWIQRETKA